MTPRLSFSIRVLIALALTLVIAIVLFFVSYGTLNQAFGRWMLEAPGRSELEFWSYLWLPVFALLGVVFLIVLMTLNVMMGNFLDNLFDEPVSAPKPYISEPTNDDLQYAPPRWSVNRVELPDARQMPPPPRHNSYAPNTDRRQLVTAPPNRTPIIQTDIVPEAPQEPSHLPKRESFENEFAFAEYVARLITRTGKYDAKSRGDIIHLIKHDRLVGTCAVLLINKSDYVSIKVIRRIAQQRVPGTSIVMLATTGKTDRTIRQEAKRLDVRLLDGHDLQRIEDVLKRRRKRQI